MGFFDSISSFFNNMAQVDQGLATNSGSTTKKVLPYKIQAISQTQKDIKTWKTAVNLYNAEEPKNYLLQLLYDDVANDSLLTSQIENRNNQLYSVDFVLKTPSGEVDEEQTKKLRKMPIYRKLTNAILMARYRGYSMVEISTGLDRSGNITVLNDEIPRTNFVPRTGLFYPDYLDDKNIKYREVVEYGRNILEFGDGDIGLLNKAVPYVLFKKFAVSCWSELCEIYGIPPRVIKTNTQDKDMLNRAETMMQDVGAAAWFIIDQSEEFEWAKGINTNGDVYNNLIQLCNNEISMLISGAIIGQDTKNGSNAKEVASQDILSSLVTADMTIVEEEWNSTCLPALIDLGVLTGDLTFEYEPIEDIGELFERTHKALQYMEVDPEWFKTKFGIEVTQMKSSNTLNYDPNFFD